MSEEQTNALIKVRPTVFVGLGGTGMEILLRLRRRILDAEWNGTQIDSLPDFPVASFLYFDLDRREARESDRTKQTDSLAKAIEFDSGETLQEKLDHSKYTQALERYPLIKKWWPKANVDRIDVDKGAGQIRPLSRLYFFDRVNELRDRIRQKGLDVQASLTNANALERLGLNTQPELRVVVVSSSAGGTGGGTLLDVGYLVGSIFPQARVDAIMLLAGGYLGANKDRVCANSFAVLKELEYCMRRNTYVDQWTDYDRDTLKERPYDDIFLVDTANVIHERTKYVEDIYNMVADILFENFGSGEFAAQKRSVAVNQEQHKLLPFHPPMSEEFGRRSLSFSRGYSTFGQSILDTQWQATKDARICLSIIKMVQEFFGVAGKEQSHLPSPEERQKFMTDYLYLKLYSFNDFPKDLDDQPNAISQYAIVDELLRKNDGGSIIADIEETIGKKFDDLMFDLPNREHWPGRIEHIKSELEREILGETGSQDAAIRQKQIKQSRVELANRFKDREHGIAKSLYDRLDDQKSGGLDYTIALIEQLKDSLDNDHTGVCVMLKRANKNFKELAETMLNHRFLPSMDRLKETFGLDIIGSKKRHAEIIVKQAREDLKYYFIYSARAYACLENQELFTDFSIWLGEKKGVKDNGEVNWSGLAREFKDGREAVSEVLDDLKSEHRRIEDKLNRKDGMYMVISNDSKVMIDTLPTEDVKKWVDEAFDGFGGSKELFMKFRDNEERSKVLQKLRSVAKQNVETDENLKRSVLDELRNKSPEMVRNLLGTAMSRAMPWLDADLTGAFGEQFKSDLYKAFIAVKGKTEFEREYGKILLQIMPSGLNDISIVESGSEGRLICYVELSGIPLDVIRPLRKEWRSAYEKEKIPLHNHKDWAKFPSPVVPDLKEMKDRAKDLRLFLQGVCLGLLRRRDVDEGFYELEIEVGDWHSVGSERKIRSTGLSTIHRDHLNAKVVEKLDRCSRLQTLALSVLLKYTADHVYSPRLESKEDGSEYRIPGFVSVLATGLSSTLLKQLNEDPNLSPSELDSSHRLEQLILKWTLEIENSIHDVDPVEVSIKTEDDPVQDPKTAENKRSVHSSFYQAGWLDSLLNSVDTFPPDNSTDTNADKDPESRFKKLEELLEKNMITKDEYQSQRNDILKSI